MNKSRVCVEKSMDLVKQIGPKKTTMLVHEKEQKGEIINEKKPTYTPPITCPQAKRIKVCTTNDLKKLCTPPPPKPKKPSLFYRAMIFGMKSLVAAGLIHITTDMGVWGDTFTSRQLYENIWCGIIDKFDLEVKDTTINISKACEAERELFLTPPPENECVEKMLTKQEENSYKMMRRWNNMIITLFANLSKIPIKLNKMLKGETKGQLKYYAEDKEECDVEETD